MNVTTGYYMQQPSSQYSQLGSMAGSAGGMMLGGPIGGMIGGAAGGMLGGMFDGGPKKKKIQQQIFPVGTPENPGYIGAPGVSQPGTMRMDPPPMQQQAPDNSMLMGGLGGLMQGGMGMGGMFGGGGGMGSAGMGGMFGRNPDPSSLQSLYGPLGFGGGSMPTAGAGMPGGNPFMMAF